MTERESIACPKCKLVQFRTAKDLCRRCKASTAPEPEPVIEVVKIEPPSTPIAPGRELNHAVAIVLRAHRKGMQSNLARKMGIGRTYICKCEHGDLIPTLGNLFRFAKAFGIPPWVLIQEIDAAQKMLVQAKAVA